MTGLDTNVLVRYVMQDDARQAAAAARLVESLSGDAPGYVSKVTLVELVWVLSSCFELQRAELADAVEAIARTDVLHVEQPESVWKALRRFRAGSADFADCLIERSCAAAGCDRTMTFDRDAAKHAGMTLLA